MSSAGFDAAARLAAAQAFFRSIPHSGLLGLEVVACEPRVVVARLPYKPELVGNPYTGWLHGGAVVTLVDQTSGAAVIHTLERPDMVATLDLRIDHLRPPQPGRAVLARAECYRVARDIAFVRCLCYEDDPDDPFVSSMSTFMRVSRPRGSVGEGQSA